MWSIGLRNPNFEVKSTYAEVDTLPFMSSALPVSLLTVGYLVFVLKVGPAMMKNRKPFELKNTLIAYNTIQMAMATYMAARINGKYFIGIDLIASVKICEWPYFFITLIKKVGKYLYANGLVHSKCYADSNDMRKEFFNVSWIYFIVKITELLDTVFFVLRKKYNQVSFLHVYHHTLMMAGTWLFLKFFPHDNLLFMGCINSVVHVFMYGYYAMSAVPSLTKHLWWKKYITTLQLVQFVAIFFHYQLQQFYCSCPPSKVVVFIVTLNNFLIMYLFTKFYIENYRKNGGLEAKKEKSIANGNGRVTNKKKVKAP